MERVGGGGGTTLALSVAGKVSSGLGGEAPQLVPSQGGQ